MIRITAHCASNIDASKARAEGAETQRLEEVLMEIGKADPDYHDTLLLKFPRCSRRGDTASSKNDNDGGVEWLKIWRNSRWSAHFEEGQ